MEKNLSGNACYEGVSVMKHNGNAPDIVGDTFEPWNKGIGCAI